MAKCYDCGLEYGGFEWADVVVSDGVWEKINPSENKGGGLLCFNCMSGRLTRLGLSNIPLKITSGPFCISEDGELAEGWVREKTMTLVEEYWQERQWELHQLRAVYEKAKEDRNIVLRNLMNDKITVLEREMLIGGQVI